jgi:hypothetical protein
MKIKFYEVLDHKQKWAAIYSPLLQHEVPAFEMAKITARHTNGTVYVVTDDKDEERVLVWPNQ